MCDGQKDKRDDFWPVSRHHVRHAEISAYGIGVRFEFLPPELGQVLPYGTISRRPAAEFRP
jgi:hypothetical protein